MHDSLTHDDRRQVRVSLILALAGVFTLAFGALGTAGAGASAAGRTTTIAAAVAAANQPEMGPQPSEAETGCGCAEACLAQSR